VVTTSDAWLVHQLTGAFVTDASTASRTMLLDLDSTSWSPAALEIFGLGSEAMPEVVDVAGSFGETSLFSSSSSTGGAARRPIPLTGLMVDQQAALLAESCLEPGTAKCTYGTGAFLLGTVGRTSVRSSSGLTTSVAWRLDGVPTYCLDGQVFTVASAVRWLTDLGVIAGAEDLDVVGSGVPDSGGVVFVPALAGLGGPWWRGDARGSLVGLGLDTSAGHLVRALVDGIAGQVVELVAALAADLGRPLTSLRVDGGLTRSRMLMQTQADLLQVPVEVFASPDATALGVAAAARIGLAPDLGVEAALGPWAPAAMYEPSISADEAGVRRAAFVRAVAATLEHGSR
jgi:glycerol kinase